MSKNNKKKSPMNNFNNKNDNNKWKSIGNNILLWVVIIIASVALAQMFSSDGNSRTISFTKYEEILSNSILWNIR